jgi:hypothetical protein
MNFSMFLPQMAEQDTYGANGQQTDDINSLVEYIDQVVLGNHDDTPEDEDNDEGQNFQIAKSVDYFFKQQSYIIDQPFTLVVTPIYSDYIHTKLSAVSFDIITPPPEA